MGLSLLLIGSQMTVFADSKELEMAMVSSSEFNQSKIQNLIQCNTPVVLYGEDISSLSDVFDPSFVITNRTESSTGLVVSGFWVQETGNKTIEHQLRIYDISYHERLQDKISNWIEESAGKPLLEDYIVESIITIIEYHEPYGFIETEMEVLNLVDDNTEYDWYDVSINQRLIPGSNYSSSSWEWNWLTYTMNGSLGKSNSHLSSYDQPLSNELPRGPFSFLWRIMGFDIRDLIPWLNPPEPRVEGIDMSDFSQEVFQVRYSAQEGYMHKNEPFIVNHHYVVRVTENQAPVFWHQTQVKYIRTDDIAKIPYITPPLLSGYVEKQIK
ncbi:hypothetical protein GF326_04030 [Candidatus Bathyarchaeota archaeon]|nr:hypothetical protein [Candidatus Bathyarchaeota archaeon]